MQSKRQPKVHKYSKKKRRRITSPGRTLLSIGFTFLVAGAIGVVGYSIAKPILQYTGTDAQQESANQPVPTETVISAAEVASIAETATSAAVTEEPVQTVETGVGIQLPEAALQDAEALSDALTAARMALPDGKILVIPLKIQGGAILYQTGVELAKQCGAVQGSLSLSEIVAAAKAQGWTPVAQVSLLYDNLLPNADAQAGYLVTDGSRWLDNKKENGGKAWTSPFSDVTVQYLKALTSEITTAGFVQIWCTDVLFPPFRDSDLSYIGESVQSENRKDSLVQLVNTLADTAGSVPLLVQVDAAGAAAGTEEVFDPDALAVSGIVMDFKGDVQQTKPVLTQIAQNAPGLSLWITTETADVSEEMEPMEQLALEFSLSGYVLREKK